MRKMIRLVPPLKRTAANSNRKTAKLIYAQLKSPHSMLQPQSARTAVQAFDRRQNKHQTS